MPTLEAQDGRITSMGFPDELKDKAEEFGDKAKEGFETAKGKTEDVIENVKDRLDDDAPADKASDAGDSSEVGYDAAEGIKEAVANTADSARSALEDPAALPQESVEGIGETAPVGATEPAVADLEDAAAEAQQSAPSMDESAGATEDLRADSET